MGLAIWNRADTPKEGGRHLGLVPLRGEDEGDGGHQLPVDLVDDVTQHELLEVYLGRG